MTGHFKTMAFLLGLCCVNFSTVPGHFRLPSGLEAHFFPTMFQHLAVVLPSHSMTRAKNDIFLPPSDLPVCDRVCGGHQ